MPGGDGDRRSGARRFWTSVALAVPLVALSLAHGELGGHVYSAEWMRGAMVVELALATIIVPACGWPVLTRVGRALRGSGFDAVTVLGLAAAAAYAYGVLAVLVPGAFPTALQNAHGLVEPRFEVGALLIALALLVRRWRPARLGGAGPRMDWLTQNWVWVVVLAFGALVLLRRGGHHGFGALGGHGGRGHGSGHGDWPAEGDRGTGSGAPGPEGRAIDPVSGKSIDTEHAITTYHRGRVYFFENEENRRRFEAAPDEFAKNVEGMDVGSPRSSTHRSHRGHGCC